MSEATATEDSSSAETAVQHGNPGVFVALILLALVVSAVLIGGFWGDKEATTEFTPLQTHIDGDDIGPGVPIPD